jgi:REP element-mobilizing transposase RayT
MMVVTMIETADRPFPTHKRFLPGGTSSWGVMHAFNRTAGGLFLFGEAEKDYFRFLVHGAAHFCGLEVLGWTCLDNHFHLILNVPSEVEGARLRAEVSEEEIFARMEKCYSQIYLKDTKQRIKKFRSRPGKEHLAEDIIRRLRAQMYDISNYMHIVQRRFSAWFNDRHDRRGTLWQGRFGSTLVESSGEALRKTAAYIDLNAVRAGIVDDPKDYRWCGYAEAEVGRTEGVAGVVATVRMATDCPESEPISASEAIACYRDWLAELGAPVIDEQGGVVRRGFGGAGAGGESKGNGNPGPAARLGTRIRYFTASLVIGSRAFCEEHFRRYRYAFGPNRQSGARPLRHGNWGGLCGLRDLRRNVIGMPR